MFDNNPFSAALSPFREAASSIGQWVSDRLADLGDFLDLNDAPVTEPIQEPYEPPFTGGQCLAAEYSVQLRNTFGYVDGRSDTFQNLTVGTFGKIRGTRVSEDRLSGFLLAAGQTGTPTDIEVASAGGAFFVRAVDIVSLTRVGGIDNCGDLPNPNPALPPSANGYGSGNPDDGMGGDIVYAGLPVLSAAALIAALKLLADAISAVADALDGIRKIGEALKGIIDLLKELLDGKKEDDKEKPKNRKYSVGQWSSMTQTDGLIETKPITLDGKIALPYKVQVVIKEFPNTSSRILGVLSPSISIDSLPLFYLLLQEDDFGITAVKTIRTLSSSTSIPPFHRGVFWNFRLNPQMEGKYRLFYQTEPEEEELVPE